MSGPASYDLNRETAAWGPGRDWPQRPHQLAAGVWSRELLACGFLPVGCSAPPHPPASQNSGVRVVQEKEAGGRSYEVPW